MLLYPTNLVNCMNCKLQCKLKRSGLGRTETLCLPHERKSVGFELLNVKAKKLKMQLLKVVKKRASCYSPSSVSLFELILVIKSDQSVLSLSRNTSKLTTF